MLEELLAWVLLLVVIIAGGAFGGAGFALVVTRKIDKKIKEWEAEFDGG